MSTSIAQQRQDLQAKIAEATEKIASLDSKLRALDELLDSISSQRQQYQVLGDICASLEKLSAMGAADLLWGEQLDRNNSGLKLQRIQTTVAEFQHKISTIEQSRHSLQNDIQDKLNAIGRMSARLARVQEVTERIRKEYVVERAARAMPYRPVVMPWTKQGEDEQRFSNILVIFFLIAIALGVLVSLWKLPPLDRDKGVVVPERLAQLIKKKREKPPEPKPQEKKEEKPVEKEEEKPADKGETTTPKSEAQQARARAETKGVLALKSNIADLLRDSSSVKLGADTRISNSGKQTAGEAPRRSIIVAQGGSGGISTPNLGRQGMGSARPSIASPSVKIARVESAIGINIKEVDRPLSKRQGPSRTDEEIQIVFDRYKSALYRIYNRELHSDPSLRGKMVLRITIETDGRVSACSVKSTDLVSSTLSTDIVDRILKFNFGPKEGVPAVTILYPIEFLPAI